jgi:hypothetical protein
MFNKKTTVSNQMQIKEKMIKELTNVIYGLKKGNFNSELDKGEVKKLLDQIQSKVEEVNNSLGTGDQDITIGVNKVHKSLQKLMNASKENLLSRFEDSVLNLIDDFNEIIDLENGIITEIQKDEEGYNRKQKQFKNKLAEMDQYSQKFIENKNRVEIEIKKFERDKKELDSKILSETNNRVKENIFRQIKASMNKIDALRVKSSEYSSSFNLLDSIKVYAKELVEIGSISNEELNKAKIIINIDKIKLVLDNPNKLQSLLKVIELDLKKSQENIKLRDKQVDSSFNIGDVSHEAMNNYENELIKNSRDVKEVTAEHDELDAYLKNLEK